MMNGQKRTAERSTPVSRILQNKEPNIPLATPSSRKKIRSFLQDTPHKIHKPDDSFPSDSPAGKKVTALATSCQKFRIYRDRSTRSNTEHQHNKIGTTSTSAPMQLKTPVSELKNNIHWKAAQTENTKTPTTKKISRDTLNQDFKIYGGTNLSFSATSPAVSDSSLLHDVLYPMIKLDQWHKIHQVDILTRETIENAYIVLESSPINNMLTSAKVQSLEGEIFEVLLLNYQQSITASKKFQNIKKGDKVALIEGFDILSKMKMYHNWRLQV